MDHVHNEPEPRVFSSAMGGQQLERRRVERKMRIHRQPKTLITGIVVALKSRESNLAAVDAAATV